MAIQIQQTENGYLIDIPSTIDISRIQSLVDNLEFFEILSKSKATKEDVEILSKEVKSNWSSTMKDRLSKLDEFKDLF